MDSKFSDASPTMLTMTELRVLSGLSRGAALPLEDSVSIGSDFSCDLILVDPDIAAQQATLGRDAAGALLLKRLHRSAEELKSGVPPTETLEHGHAFDVGGVRMIVCESDAEWDFALPVVPPPPLSPIEAAVADGVAAGRLGRGAAAPSAPRRKLSKRQVIAIAGAAAALSLLAFVLWVIFNREEAKPPPAPPVAQRSYSQAEVDEIAKTFARRLDDLNIGALKLATSAQQLSIRGQLDRNAESRFETAVQELRDGHPGLKVRLELGADGGSVLPFEVTAAVGGSSGSVLLADGQQLFVGAEEAGFKFLGMTGNCLNFLQVATQQKVSQCSEQNPRRR